MNLYRIIVLVQTICSLGLWCLAVQEMKTSLVASHLKMIVAVLLHGIDNPLGSMVITYEAFQACKLLLLYFPYWNFLFTHIEFYGSTLYFLTHYPKSLSLVCLPLFSLSLFLLFSDLSRTWSVREEAYLSILKRRLGFHPFGCFSVELPFRSPRAFQPYLRWFIWYSRDSSDLRKKRPFCTSRLWSNWPGNYLKRCGTSHGHGHHLSIRSC